MRRAEQLLGLRMLIRVHDYPNGTVAISHGPRCLARWRLGCSDQIRLLRVPSAAFGADGVVAS